MVPRDLLSWQWWGSASTTRLYLYCLLKANPCDENINGETVERGSFYTSRAILASETGLTEQQVRDSLERLEKTKKITSKRTNKRTNRRTNWKRGIRAKEIGDLQADCWVLQRACSKRTASCTKDRWQTETCHRCPSPCWLFCWRYTESHQPHEHPQWLLQGP